jgi:hypothetical protein
MVPKYLVIIFLIASISIFGLREAAFLKKYNTIRQYKVRYVYSIASVGKYRWAKFVLPSGYEIFTRILNDFPLDSETTIYQVHENYRDFSQFGMDNYEATYSLVVGKMVDIYINERIKYCSDVSTPVTLILLLSFTILLLKSNILIWKQDEKKELTVVFIKFNTVVDIRKF